MDVTRPAYIEVDLNNLEYNFDRIKESLDEASEIMAMVKADAYGLGVEYIVKELIGLGVNKFGVMHLFEALQIRNKFKYAYILVMGYTPDHLVEMAIKNDIVLSVFLKEQARFYSNWARELNKRLSIHIKVEIATNKIGFKPTRESVEEIKEVYGMDKLFVEGLYTDLPTREDEEAYTRRGMEIFNQFNKDLRDIGVHIQLKHVNIGVTASNFSGWTYNMVRTGIRLYGISPDIKENTEDSFLKPCLSLKAQVFDVKTLEMGRRFVRRLNCEVKRKRKIATVPLGCQDTYTSQLTNVENVLIKGKRCPVIGKVYMDQMMVDVTGLNVNKGDEVVLIGKQNEEQIRIEEVAKDLVGVPDSVMCILSRRLNRVYIKSEEVKNEVN